jgi:hypothetical protein
LESQILFKESQSILVAENTQLFFWDFAGVTHVNFDAAAKHRNQCIEQHNDAIIRSVIALASAFRLSFRPPCCAVGPTFGRAVYLRPAELHALGDGALETCLYPLANHRPLEFSKGASYLENELAHGCRRVDGLLVQVKVHAARFEVLDCIE